MKFSGFENIDAGVRSAILISVAANHRRFLTCKDLELGGQYMSTDCLPGYH
jgi:hypothetical protein